MTPLVILFAQYRDDDSGMSGRDPTLSVVSLLPLIYVVLDRTARTLAICLFFASIGCASLALQSPPAILVSMNWHLGPHAAAPILWSALLSVWVASFGANAHAAVDATY
ncbi:MAG: hypothetical protein ABI407_10535 [Bradyrhizobium sp.]